MAWRLEAFLLLGPFGIPDAILQRHLTLKPHFITFRGANWHLGAVQ